MVIDTPGMRELGLFDADEGIRAGFTDVEELFAQCRFKDCRHQTEPGCAVLAALADGSLPPEVGSNMLLSTMRTSMSKDKTSYLIDKRARNKTIAMWSKQTKKNGGWKK